MRFPFLCWRRGPRPFLFALHFPLAFLLSLLPRYALPITLLAARPQVTSIRTTFPARLPSLPTLTLCASYSLARCAAPGDVYSLYVYGNALPSLTVCASYSCAGCAAPGDVYSRYVYGNAVPSLTLCASYSLARCAAPGRSHSLYVYGNAVPSLTLCASYSFAGGAAPGRSYSLYISGSPSFAPYSHAMRFLFLC